MNIKILTIGSRGDVQPYLALGQGLIAAGHTVTLVTAGDFRALCEQHGVPLAPISVNVYAMMNNEAGLRAMESGNMLGFFRKMMAQLMPAIEQTAREVIDHCQEADLILTSSLTLFAAALRDKFGIPFVPTYPQPTLPTRDFPSFTAPVAPAWFPFKRTYNLFTHYALLHLMYQMFRKPGNTVRTKMLGLSPMSPMLDLTEAFTGDFPILFGYSPAVIPPTSDMIASAHITGYWFAQLTAWQPPADLVRFIEAGSPPVYVGFGSMTDRDPEALTHLIADALAQTGQRAVLLSGWGGIGKLHLPDTIHVVESVSHEWLLPRMAAAVHHGGAGTTAASLRAGLPTVIVPFIADQPFFGERVHALGVGPAPVARKSLTAEALGAAIHTAVSDKAMRAKAVALGECIRAEDGVAEAVRLIEAYGHRAVRAN